MADDEVLARYPLRTPRGYVAVLVLLAVMGVAALVVLAMWMSSPYRGTGGWLGVMLLVLAVTPLWYGWTTRAYRIAGGRGELAFLGDRVELRDGRGTVTPFAAAALTVTATPMVVRYRAWGVITLGERRAGMLLGLRSGAARVALSSKLFEDEDWVAGFIEDVALVRAGERPLGPRRPAPPPKSATVSPEGYDYEAELDRELRRYD